MPKMMFETLQIGIPCIAVRALFFQLLLMIRMLILVVDQVRIDLETINLICLYAINFVMGEVVFMGGSKL